jgi:hypothetical protein
MTDYHLAGRLHQSAFAAAGAVAEVTRGVGMRWWMAIAIGRFSR